MQTIGHRSNLLSTKLLTRFFVQHFLCNAYRIFPLWGVLLLKPILWTTLKQLHNVRYMPLFKGNRDVVEMWLVHYPLRFYNFSSESSLSYAAIGVGCYVFIHLTAFNH